MAHTPRPGPDEPDQAIGSDGGRSDPKQARVAGLRALVTGETAQATLRELLPYLARLIDDSASPERATTHFARWLQSSRDQARLLSYLAGNLRALEMVITLFAGSPFLTGIFLRNPAYFRPLLEPNQLVRVQDVDRFVAEASAAAVPAGLAAATADLPAALDALRRYQQGELLRIGLADLLGLLDLSTVTAQLSCLAEAIVRVCLALASASSGVNAAGFSVLAMGKLGGNELNYSSDIDLLFLAEQDANTYERLARDLIKMLTKATGAGFLYRVDMRLRPWGSVGPLVPTLAGYKTYLAEHARLWEKQALLKARVVAGNGALGEAVLAYAASLPARSKPDGAGAGGTQEAVRAGIRAMKDLTEAELVQQGREWGEVKLGKGSIRDVEFVTQYLQMIHCPQHPWLRTGNTLEALDRLGEAGLLHPDEQRVLVEGYVFLRTVEHYLQMFDYRQTNTLPAKPAELTYLAQRLGFHGRDTAGRFIARYQQHSAAIRAIYQYYLGAMTMNVPATGPANQEPEDAMHAHMARMSASYGANFSSAEIRRHAAMAERLSTDKPIEVEAEEAGDGLWRMTIVGYDYAGELSLICGLIFVHGFNIQDGNVYTYDLPPGTDAARTDRPRADARTKIVDVFTVRPFRGEVAPDLWLHYADELSGLLRLVAAGRQREAQGKLATSIALALRDLPASGQALQPIELEIDNDTSERYTILRISTVDTVGFLYEFTNALALTGLYISEVAVSSAGNRVYDVLFVTNRYGRKITNADKQRELRATVVLIKHFTHLLPQSPNPQSALLHFHAYLGELLRRPTWPDELASLERPEALQALARLLGVSDFLWEDFLRMQYANLFPVVRDVNALAVGKSRAQLQDELAAVLSAAGGAGDDGAGPAASRAAKGTASLGAISPRGEARRAALNAFKDREMFRTDMRYIMGHLPGFEEFGAELTQLAEVVLGAAYELCDGELRARYGAPYREDGRPSALSIGALGKCGGRELGFASDIELMFVYDGNGMTAGPQSITTAEYYEKLVPAFVQAIKARREGIFEIDLQLRPYGAAGSLAVSLASFQRYFAPDGPAWSYERQALIKLRPIAGDATLGEQVTALRDQYVYSGAPFDVVAMRAMRERQIRYMVSAGSFNAKFSLGGLVDVEYLVQGLQISHGHQNSRLRTTNTAAAMAALADAGLLKPEEYAFLREAHAFLWRLIEALRVVRGNAKDLNVPPVESEEFGFLARRLGYGRDVGRLQDLISASTAGVRRLIARL